MTRYSYINKNIERIKYEIKIGLISPTILKHWEIYSRFDYYIKAGNTISNAALFAGDDNNVDSSWVFKIKNQMESEV